MKKRILSLLLVVCLLLPGCQSTQENAPSKATDFQTFTDELFRSYVTSDSLTLNYMLSSPEQYGITDLPDGFPAFQEKDLKQNMSTTENTLAHLQQFDRESLSFSDKLLYDSLVYSLKQDMEDHQYSGYAYFFDPSSGIQAQLPVLLSEFLFNERSDIEQYLALIQSLPDYFDSLLSLERAKIKQGTLPCKTTIKNTIAQCQEFLDSSGTTAIRENFQKSLARLAFLSEKERTAWQQKQETYLKHYFLPAYQSLIADLQKLVSAAPEDGALASYPKGTDYYALLLRQKTGTDLSPEQLDTELTNALAAAEQELFSIAAKDPSAFISCEKYTSHYTDSKQTLLTLRKKMAEDFPDLASQTCHIRYVDSSLEDFLSPAFYLTPPIDEQTANVIYINGSSRYSHSSLFNTLAHEGYPGHLYQNCYIRQKNLRPLRYALNFPGYTEGYATYVEIYSYRYLGAPEKETLILQNNAVSTHCIYALCDLGIHYKHWSKEQLRTFLQAHGIYADASINSIYQNIIDSPGSYLPYTVGYLEIQKLKKDFEKAAGNAYTDKLFHTWLLDAGPAPYSVLRHSITAWLAEKT